MQLISGNTTLTNQRLDNLSKDIADLKESLEFTQEETEGKFNTLIEKISTIEKKLFSLKKDIGIIQTTNYLETYGLHYFLNRFVIFNNMFLVLLDQFY